MQMNQDVISHQVTRRRRNVLSSPKRGGDAMTDSQKYLDELNITIHDEIQPIQYTGNMKRLVHRWAPYVQGFSSDFVQGIFDKYKNSYRNPRILDPFSGCGTVPVQAKLNGLPSFGVEINPLMHYINNVKLNSWDVDPSHLVEIYKQLDYSYLAEYPDFLQTHKQFEPGILESLRRVKGAIEQLSDNTDSLKEVDLLWVAFCSILIDSSNLKRSPCLGYAKKKNDADTPYQLFDRNIQYIVEDLRILQHYYRDSINTEAHIELANSLEYEYADKYDLVITSPPYMNGMDYVMNYKIEMAWMGFAENQKTLRQLKNSMVVCDNVSRNLIAEHEYLYTNRWIEDVKRSIERRIIQRGSYRRDDMPDIVHKYFDDMYRVFKRVIPAMRPKGRFILVVGDSLIADTYVPTDLFLAKMGQDLGLRIESIAKARDRRSGQIRCYKLRETIITLIKE